MSLLNFGFCFRVFFNIDRCWKPRLWFVWSISGIQNESKYLQNKKPKINIPRQPIICGRYDFLIMKDEQMPQNGQNGININLTFLNPVGMAKSTSQTYKLSYWTF
mmetsp:Transcript_45310/g.120492  ORF Transcript_45310/g.120492 Transcript_45310/m.120492 type:complete len:105 (+) Transcript_45310:949-1263(+)